MTRAAQLIVGDELLDGAGQTELADRAARVAERWLFSDAMRGLLAMFGDSFEDLPEASAASARGWLHLQEELPSWTDEVLRRASDFPPETARMIDLLSRALRLEQWAAARFNFRGGDGVSYKERNQASSAGFDETTRDGVFEHAAGLGLTGSSRPRHDRYDYTLVLGGARLSPLLRARYAAMLLREDAAPGTLYFLGSPRPLFTEPPEREGTVSYAPDAVDEFDLMVAGAVSEFDGHPGETIMLCGCSSIEEICPRWPYAGTPAAEGTPARFTHERRTSILDAAGTERGIALSASTSRPPYRPDTTDTLALWGRQAQPRPGRRALVVTAQVFVPFQTFDCLKRLYLEHAVDVDAVGYSAEWAGRVESPEYLLQETLSAIRSGRRLLVEAIAPLARR